MKKRIASVSVLQAGIVIGALQAGLILAVELLLLPFFALAIVFGSASMQGQFEGMIGGMIGFIFFACIAPIFYGIIGFVMGLIMALIYNLIAKITGGLELTLVDA